MKFGVRYGTCETEAIASLRPVLSGALLSSLNFPKAFVCAKLSAQAGAAFQIDGARMSRPARSEDFEEMREMEQYDGIDRFDQ